MSEFDNGFKKAQRDYDNQVPPECETEPFDCEDCEGTGENPEGQVCKTCDGNGFIELSQEEIRKANRDGKKLNEAEAKEFYDKHPEKE